MKPLTSAQLAQITLTLPTLAATITARGTVTVGTIAVYQITDVEVTQVSTEATRRSLQAKDFTDQATALLNQSNQLSAITVAVVSQPDILAANPPVAAFIASPVSGTTAPVKVQFKDMTTGGTAPLTYKWNMSDGAGNLPENAQQNPLWRFWDVKSYTITLTVTDAVGRTSTVTKPNYITVGTPPVTNPPPVAAFSMSTVSGMIPLTVQFTDVSSGTPTAWAWDFGDGSPVDTTKGPSHIYAVAGNYTAKLTVTNANGSASVSKTVTALVPSAGKPPVAAFSAAPVAGSTPLNVQFTDTSTNKPTVWAWTFGDGGVSSVQSPTHIYTAIGTYTVALTATNASGSNVVTKTFFITVVSPTPTPVPTTGFGCPATVAFNGVQYAIGGSYPFVTSEGKVRGGGIQYPVFTAGVPGGSYKGDTITTADDLIAAYLAAKSPAVIYVDGKANIDMGASENIQPAAGVTIASNRGFNGSRGGRIFSKHPGSGWNTPVFRVPKTSSNVRFTGLFLEGEAAAIDAGWTESTYKVGIWADGPSGFQVDNCELYGFAYADIYCAGCPTGPGAPWLHHNFVHGSPNKNEGYGFDVGKSGDMIVEANVFDLNRHDVTSDGDIGDRFTIRNNIITGNPFLTIGRAHFDAHGGMSDVQRATSGVEYQIFNNTFEAGSSQLCIHQRGKPQVAMRIHHNLFAGDSGGAGFNGLPVCQSADPDSGNMDIHDNYWAKSGVNPSLPANQFFAGATGIIQIN